MHANSNLESEAGPAPPDPPPAPLLPDPMMQFMTTLSKQLEKLTDCFDKLESENKNTYTTWVVIVRGLENPGGLSKGRWRVGVRVHILYPSCTLTLEEGTQGYKNTLEIFKGLGILSISLKISESPWI